MSADATEVEAKINEEMEKLKRELLQVRVDAEQCQTLATTAGASLLTTIGAGEQSLNIGKVALDKLAVAISHASPKIAAELEVVQFLAAKSREDGLRAVGFLQDALNAAKLSSAYSTGATAVLNNIIHSLPLENTVAAQLAVPLVSSGMAESLKALDYAFSTTQPFSTEAESVALHLSVGISPSTLTASTSGATVQNAADVQKEVQKSEALSL